MNQKFESRTMKLAKIAAKAKRQKELAEQQANEEFVKKYQNILAAEIDLQMEKYAHEGCSSHTFSFRKMAYADPNDAVLWGLIESDPGNTAWHNLAVAVRTILEKNGYRVTSLLDAGGLTVELPYIEPEILYSGHLNESED